MRKLQPKTFFSREEKNQIVRAIRDAEDRTSSEIRVYLERKAKTDVMKRAKKVFEKLGMTRTKYRNGVLIYFSLRDQNFSILGDKGIHEKVGNDFWKDIAFEMQTYFSKGDFTGGLETGIREIGAQLKKYFPLDSQDINELPDELNTN